MDNREFAKVLLCEATDLLSESSGKNGLARRIYEEKYGKDDPDAREKEQEKIDRLKSHSISNKTDDMINKREHELHADESNRRHLSYRGKNAYNYSAMMAKNPVNTSLDSVVNRKDNKRAEYVDERMGEYHRNMASNKANASRVNKNINKRAQNECADLAVLLTEAALLLNENSIPDTNSRELYNKIDNLKKEVKEQKNDLNDIENSLKKLFKQAGIEIPDDLK